MDDKGIDPSFVGQDEELQLEEQDVAEIYEVNPSDLATVEDEDMIDVQQSTQESTIIAPPTSASKSFNHHKGSVFSLSYFNGIVVTGGEDDKAFACKTSDASVIQEFSNHSDSISHVGFNIDGSLLFIADMSGIIRVWKNNTNNFEEIWNVETGDLKCVEWHAKAKSILIVATVDGQLWMYVVPSGDCKIFLEISTPITCFKQIPPACQQVLVGYENGQVSVVDLKSSRSISSIKPKDNTAVEVTKVAVSNDGILGAVGCSDGSLNVYKVDQLQTIWKIEDKELLPISNEDIVSIEGLEFSPSNPQWLTAATMKGVVIVYDVSSKTKRSSCQVPDCGFTILKWPANSTLCYLGSAEGRIFAFSPHQGKIVRQYTGMSDVVLDVAVSTVDAKIFACGDDKTCRMFPFE